MGIAVPTMGLFGRRRKQRGNRPATKGSETDSKGNQRMNGMKADVRER